MSFVDQTVWDKSTLVHRVRCGWESTWQTRGWKAKCNIQRRPQQRCFLPQITEQNGQISKPHVEWGHGPCPHWRKKQLLTQWHVSYRAGFWAALTEPPACAPQQDSMVTISIYLEPCFGFLSSTFFLAFSPIWPKFFSQPWNKWMLVTWHVCNPRGRSTHWPPGIVHSPVFRTCVRDAWVRELL